MLLSSMIVSVSSADGLNQGGFLWWVFLLGDRRVSIMLHRVCNDARLCDLAAGVEHAHEDSPQYMDDKPCV